MPAGRHFNDWRRRPGGGAAALLVAARVSACVPWRGKSRSAPANSRARGSNFPRPTPAGPLAAAGRRGVTGRTRGRQSGVCAALWSGLWRLAAALFQLMIWWSWRSCETDVDVLTDRLPSGRLAALQGIQRTHTLTST
jgi:hypothetical protein